MLRNERPSLQFEASLFAVIAPPRADSDRPPPSQRPANTKCRPDRSMHTKIAGLARAPREAPRARSRFPLRGPLELVIRRRREVARGPGECRRARPIRAVEPELRELPR